MLIMIDNYDSFTYNLVQYLGILGAEVKVYSNDKITPEEVEAQRPDGVVISPGPGDPTDAGVSVEVIRRMAGKVPVLGVCLGHQSMAYAFGAEIVRAKRVLLLPSGRVEQIGAGAGTSGGENGEIVFLVGARFTAKLDRPMPGTP